MEDQRTKAELGLDNNHILLYNKSLKVSITHMSVEGSEAIIQKNLKWGNATGSWKQLQVIPYMIVCFFNETYEDIYGKYIVITCSSNYPQTI